MTGLYTLHYRPELPKLRDLDILVAGYVYHHAVGQDKDTPILWLGQSTRTIATTYPAVCPFYSSTPQWIPNLIQWMEGHGYWSLLKSAFSPGYAEITTLGDLCWAGFTPHGMTGWASQPDYYASSPNLQHALCYAAILTDPEGRAYFQRYYPEALT